MPHSPVFAAVDLGASSGRVMLGRVDDDQLTLDEVHRFDNTPIRLPDGLHWNILGLYRGVLDGLRLAAAHAPDSVGIDSWAVDYGLLDEDGVLLGNPYHYRDARHVEAVAAVHRRIDAADLYRINGLQQIPINTVYQLEAARGSSVLDSAATLLLIPDLLIYWLTGEVGAEVTNASTTGLYDAGQHRWSRRLVDQLGIRGDLLPPLRSTGTPAGGLRREAGAETGMPGLAVTAVASHDTASAVAAVPADDDAHFAFISCGTWSLAGLELDTPVLSEASRTAGFTNELGVDSTVRYLRNIMGLWLLEECLRSWRKSGHPARRDDLLAAAAEAKPFRTVINPDDPCFLAPEDMPSAIADFCARTGQLPPEDAPSTVRCVLEGLALAHRHTLRNASVLSGRSIDVVHIVGGGSKNALLCQLTADACGLPVIAGPAEATSLGNILVQARVHGVIRDRAAGRRLVAATQPLRRYLPSGDDAVWRRAAARVGLD